MTFWDEYAVPVVLLAVLALILGGIIWSAIDDRHQRDAWLEQCVSDGNKRYVCEERWSTAHPPSDSNTVIIHAGHP